MLNKILLITIKGDIKKKRFPSLTGWKKNIGT
jgi:hypothetical protein